VSVLPFKSANFSKKGQDGAPECSGLGVVYKLQAKIHPTAAMGDQVDLPGPIIKTVERTKGGRLRNKKKVYLEAGDRENRNARR